jgi:hypothetical protein
VRRKGDASIDRLYDLVERLTRQVISLTA